MFLIPSLFSTFYPSLSILKPLHLSLSHIHTMSVFLSHVNPPPLLTLTTPYYPLTHYFLSPYPFSSFPFITLLTLFPHNLQPLFTSSFPDLLLSPFSHLTLHPLSPTLLTPLVSPYPKPSNLLPSLSSGMFNTNADRATVFTRGFPVGFHIGNSKRSSKHYLYNHIRIILQYHDDKVATTQGTGTATATESSSTKVCVLEQLINIIKFFQNYIKKHPISFHQQYHFSFITVYIISFLNTDCWF